MSTAFVTAELMAPGEESIRPDEPMFVYKGQLRRGVDSGVNTVSVNLSNVQASSPTRLILVGIGDPRLKVKKAIPVEISVGPDCVVAHFREIDEFGCGKTTSEAIDDLSRVLGELYFELESKNMHLGSDLSQVWHVLMQYFEPVRLHTDESS